MAGGVAAEPAGAPASPEWIFYDGACGFCHRSVRFFAEADRDGAFRYAPLGGETFGRLVSDEDARDLPDSLVILTREGRLLVRSEGSIHALRRLGGRYATWARLLAWIPRPIRDAAYAAFARIRHLLLPRPEQACPILPPELRARFEA